jgi:hypothetical protein
MITSRTQRRKPKVPKLYHVGPDYRIRTPPGLRMENIAALGAGPLLRSPPGQRGIPVLAESPRLLIDKTLGRAPVDWEPFLDFLLVSARMKSVLETLDSEGVQFVRCETRSLSGDAAPAYWLCDIVRLLDVVDEERSNIEILEPGTKFRRYNLMNNICHAVFRAEVIGSAHIFRPRFLESRIFCSQEMRNACTAAGLRGFRFAETSRKSSFMQISVETTEDIAGVGHL